MVGHPARLTDVFLIPPAIVAVWVGLLAASTVTDITVAFVAAVASVINTALLIRSQNTHRQIKTEVRRMQRPLEAMRELADAQESRVEELRGVNRALATRGIELRELLEPDHVTHRTDVTDR